MLKKIFFILSISLVALVVIASIKTYVFSLKQLPTEGKKNIIILFLVLLLSFNLSSACGQNSDNDYMVDINKSGSYDSIERVNTYKLRLDSLVGKRGEDCFKVQIGRAHV